MATYYPNVSAYLNPSGGGGVVAHVSNIVLSRTTLNGNRSRGVATVTVLDASNQPVSGAAVAGQFSGFYASSASGTTNASGVAVLNSAAKKNSGTVSFCVNGVSGTNITYNSGANTETCDNF
jgi:predicted oxidoreductase